MSNPTWPYPAAGKTDYAFHVGYQQQVSYLDSLVGRLSELELKLGVNTAAQSVSGLTVGGGSGGGGGGGGGISLPPGYTADQLLASNHESSALEWKSLLATAGQLSVAGADGALTFSLASTGVSAGTYGDGTHVGQFTVDATGRVTSASSVPITNTGTVTSVGLALPGIFTVSGSPVTSSGTLTGALATQSANAVFAGPSSGGAAAPAFRSLVSADIPALDAAKITSGLLALNRGGTNADLSSAASGSVLFVSGGAFATDGGLSYGGVGSSSNLLKIAPSGTGGAVNALQFNLPAGYAGDLIHAYDSSNADIFRVTVQNANQTTVNIFSPTGSTLQAAVFDGLNGYQTAVGGGIGTFGNFVNISGTTTNVGAMGWRAAESQSAGHLGTSFVLRNVKKGTAILYDAFEVSSEGSVAQLVGTLTTSATDGFWYIAKMAGQPTGAPTAIAGVPLVADSSNGLVWANYSGSSWRPLSSANVQTWGTNTNLTLTQANLVLLVGGAAFPAGKTLTLPDAALWIGGRITIKWSAANTVSNTIAAASGQTVEQVASSTLSGSAGSYRSWTYVSDGVSNWMLVGSV